MSAENFYAYLCSFTIFGQSNWQGHKLWDTVVSTTTRHLRVYTIQYFSKMGGEGRIIRLNLGCGEC
jgi:hypothetical protein